MTSSPSETCSPVAHRIMQPDSEIASKSDDVLEDGILIATAGEQNTSFVENKHTAELPFVQGRLAVLEPMEVIAVKEFSGPLAGLFQLKNHELVLGIDFQFMQGPFR